MALNEADRELLREFWGEIRANPVMLRNLLLIAIGVIGAAVCAAVLMVLIFAGIG